MDLCFAKERGRSATGVADLRVAVGQVAHRGTVLGVVESSGRATGPDTHFEVRVGGVPVDPSWVF